MTSVDPTFLKDICVNLLSDLLALKFKKSCVYFRPQNSQIKVPDFQTSNSEIPDPKSPNFQNFNSQIHSSQEGEKP